MCGCEPVPHYNRLQVAAYGGRVPRHAYGTVQVFQTPADIKRPFDIVGLMSCEGSAADEAGIVNAMLYRAADLGADGILLNPASNASEEVAGNRIEVRIGWAAIVGNGNQRAYRAQAIRFKE